jgi:hypothetical protein
MTEYKQHLKSEYLDLELDQIVTSPITVLNGVSEEAAKSLEALSILTVYDLAFSRVFSNAYAIAHGSEDPDSFVKHGIIPSDVIDGPFRSENIENTKFEDILALEGIGETDGARIKAALNVNTIYDLANWPQFVVARALVGMGGEDSSSVDIEIPMELVPRFNEYPMDKSFYSIYVIDSRRENTGNELEGAICIEDIIDPKDQIQQQIQTGRILRYEQSWTPVGLGLGNLLHSLALAPGESTRIAVIDWKRTQGVKTTEDITQLEELTNTLMQNRSINEIARAVAREAQSGFSQMNSNSTVSNNAYSSYGVQNIEETLAAAAGGALAGGGTGLTIGALGGAGIGTVAGGVGAAPGALIGAAGGGIIGATAGGVGAALSVADFGSSQNNTSNSQVDTVTVTRSSGQRDVTSEMAQNIMDRTHQHSSTSRNKRASIVQEVSQTEKENISTRVVTNYNHMHALTIQYFEVVELYRV